MRVGLLVYGMDKSLTGIARYSIELIRAFAKLKPLDVEFVLISTGGLGELEGIGFRHIQLRYSHILPLMMTVGQFQLRQLAKNLQLDIIHDLSGQMPFMLVDKYTKRLSTIHDVIPLAFKGISSKWDTLVYKFWLPIMAHRLDKIITDSDYSRCDLITYLGLPATKIRRIYIGVDASYHPRTPDDIAPILATYNIDTPYLLFVGSVDVRKNLLRVLKAYQQVSNDISCQLVIVGPRNLRYVNQLEAVLLNSKNRVILTGFVVQDDLPALYAGATAFLFPSLYEGFGLPIIEAMASGTPVITSNTTSLPEIAGEAALLVDPLDEVAIASTIAQLVHDDALQNRLREQGLMQAKKFSWNDTAQKLLKTYQQVMRQDT